MTPADLLRRELATDGARPFVTFYDDTTGERVELSVATFDNWVAKTANLLVDGLLAGPGDRVALALPTHWQTQVWLLACWSVGAVAVLGGEAAGCAVAVADPEHLDAARSCPGERVALPLLPLGGRFPAPPEGFVDYAAEVPGHGDRFTPARPPAADAPALELDGVARTGVTLAHEASQAATALGVGRGDRVLTSAAPATWPGLLAGLLIPLSAGASVVLCRHSSDDDGLPPERITPERITAERITAERVTHVLPPTVLPPTPSGDAGGHRG